MILNRFKSERIVSNLFVVSNLRKILRKSQEKNNLFSVEALFYLIVNISVLQFWE